MSISRPFAYDNSPSSEVVAFSDNVASINVIRTRPEVVPPEFK